MKIINLNESPKYDEDGFLTIDSEDDDKGSQTTKKAGNIYNQINQKLKSNNYPVTQLKSDLYDLFSSWSQGVLK